MRWFPNLLTFARIALTPAIVLSLVRADCPKALLLSLAAGATDAADGFLARRFGWATRLGAYLDPVADKFLLTSLYICFGIAGFVPSWLVWVVVGRDALILLGVAAGMALTHRRDFPPTLSGKISTTVQIAAALLFLASCGEQDLAVWAVAAATAWSAIDYATRAIRWY